MKDSRKVSVISMPAWAPEIRRSSGLPQWCPFLSCHLIWCFNKFLLVVSNFFGVSPWDSRPPWLQGGWYFQEGIHRQLYFPGVTFPPCCPQPFYFVSGLLDFYLCGFPRVWILTASSLRGVGPFHVRCGLYSCHRWYSLVSIRPFKVKMELFSSTMILCVNLHP